MIPEHLELLRRLAINDEDAVNRVMERRVAEPVPLETKTSALATMACLVALTTDDASYQWAVDAARAAGADDTEIVDVLVVVAPIVGSARVNAAAPTLALALGYELGQAGS